MFIFDLSAVAGSDDINEYAVITSAGDEFSILTNPILLDVRGLIAGKGGAGEFNNGGNAGPALSLKDDIRLSNTGTIGGGGGGGGGFVQTSTPRTFASGGGGAGFRNGTVASNTASEGSNELGGNGDDSAGNGGDLGQAGGNGSSGTGGAAGAAISLNGYTITYINTGSILGSVS